MVVQIQGFLILLGQLERETQERLFILVAIINRYRVNMIQ